MSFSNASHPRTDISRWRADVSEVPEEDTCVANAAMTTRIGSLPLGKGSGNSLSRKSSACSKTEPRTIRNLASSMTPRIASAIIIGVISMR